MGLPDLGVIVVSYNVRELLAACLAGLPAAATPLTWEAVIVDNASLDGSADMVATEFPSVRLIRNAENVGFARANNQGIAASTGRYIVLLNADTVVPAGGLARLADFMDAHPQVGACSPRLLRTDGTPQPHAFGGDPTLGYLLRRAVNRALSRRPLHDWGVASVIQVDWVSGACLMARREAVDRVGGLDERIFMYFEDNDWCLRIRRAGWQICYVPQVEITHLGGQSIAKNPAARAAYYHSLAYFYDKHYGPLKQFLLRLILSVYLLLIKYS